MRLLTYSEILMLLSSSERGISLLPARPVEPRIVDLYQASRERTLRRWGRG